MKSLARTFTFGLGLPLAFSTCLFAACAFAEDAVPETLDRSFHFQTTIVSQQHPEFPAHYTGTNSLANSADNQTSITTTFYGGIRTWENGGFFINPELAGGSGFSSTKGIAGFPNGEIYRVDDPSPKWTLARMFFKQTFGSGETESLPDDKNQLAGVQPIHRLNVIVGKFALNDYFDSNAYSHDPRTQFLNWSLMDNAAWDYAADTRGYSWGAMIELNRPSWALRFASVMVPKQANQIELETNFPQFHGNNLEFERRYKIAEQPGSARLLVFENRANMGNYRTTLNTPSYNMDVTLSRTPSEKYGIGLNADQALSNEMGLFARASWDDGHTETWAFTEVDLALSAGLSLKGLRWKRTEDVVGLALLANGLSNDHRDYLAAGGYGFIIGDGQINYAPELIAETYYLYKVLKGLDATGDYQFVENPAYNRDRGPVSVFSFRLHYEI